MKTLKFIPALLIATMFILFTGFSSYAIKPAIAPAEHIQKVISESLKYPQQALRNANTGSVDVLFTINDDGQLVIKKMSTDNKEIAEDVRVQLSKICCKDIKTPFNQYYKVTISFKLIG
jgi:hypothetical protein